jgi:hypothetical protein
VETILTLSFKNEFTRTTFFRYSKTPVGKKRNKFLEGDEEEGKKEKKKSGKKKK